MTCPGCGKPTFPGAPHCPWCKTSLSPGPAGGGAGRNVFGAASAGSVGEGATVAGIYAENLQMSPEAARELGKMLNSRSNEFTADPRLMDRFTGIDDKLAQLVQLLDNNASKHAGASAPFSQGMSGYPSSSPLSSPPSYPGQSYQPAPPPQPVNFHPVGHWRLDCPGDCSMFTSYPNGALTMMRQMHMNRFHVNGVWRYDPMHHVFMMQGLAQGMYPVFGGFKVLAQHDGTYQALGMSGNMYTLQRLG